MRERARRVAANEAFFREVNERIESLNEGLVRTTRTVEIICECGDATCIERIVVPIPEYEAVRAYADRFLLVPGHEQPGIESAVSDHGAYAVVEKTARAGREVAEQTDPRS
jgi:hypothetical protein